MKNLKSKLLVVLAIILTLTTTIAYAEEDASLISSDENQEAVVTSEENQDISNTEADETSSITQRDLYLFEESVNIDSIVSGNIYIMANEVTIDTVIDGNVFILANKVTFGENTYIYSDAFVCANEVTVDGYIYDLYNVSSKLTLSESSYIIRDVHAASGSITINGTVNRNVELTCDFVSVSSETASIGGDFTYTSSESVVIPDSSVKGTITYNKAETPDTSKVASIIAKDYITSALKVLVLALIVILIIAFAMPKFAEKEEKILVNKPWQSLGFGALALVLIPTICIILFITIFGILPAFALLFVYILAISLSSAIVSVPVAKLLCKKMKKETKTMTVLMSLVVVLAIWLLEQIPVVGGFVSLITAILGLGIIFYSIFHSKIEEKEKNVVASATVTVEKTDSKKDENE